MDPGRFHLSLKEKRAEEKNVHRITDELLRTFKDPWVELLLNRYRRCWDRPAEDSGNIQGP